ncbi:MAG: threonine--tRNA ligase [Nanoarchaeota archaeon]|nr:threonine--tRNA ligase [Nanoarchaeota archaeon]MBU1644630.1 threonine--tRNA ligase [Nanoarchaeota archaeon]MBU1976883.1 threonine--tRNA ligase [Nanoarchaeota archaeon]
MKILTIHADFIEFQAKKKAFPGAEEGIKEGKQRIEECLVVFTAVEKRDEENIKAVTDRYVQEIKNIIQQINAQNVVLYPYAHLSSSLSNPKAAENLMKDAERILSGKFKVVRAPFGWYKSFDISCKGHPLSELSREFSAEEKESPEKLSGKVKGEKSPENLGTKKEEVEEKVKTDKKEEAVDTKELLKKMSRVSMSAPPGKDGKKSNVELGKELDLYFVSEIVGGGLPLLTGKGTTIKREIERFAIDEELKRGYLHTSTPIMAKSDLYKISGHWQHYKEGMFVLKVRDETFALRPMTCPFQFVIYKHKQRSYRDLPLKYAEMSLLFRNEQSGELRGLTRVRQFTLADAHVICRPDQLDEEFEKVLDLLKYVMSKLGIKDIWYRFSKYDPNDKGGKYIDNPSAWEESQAMMKKMLDKLGLKYKEAEGEAAFYGPKLDLQYEDVYGKEDTLLTIQIDFALPEKFDLTYVDKDGTEKRPMIIHRSSSGSTERTMAYLLEKTQGKLPLWLSPVQIKVLTINDSNIPFATNVVEKMKSAGLRVELDERVESMGKKVREAQLERVNYIVTIGDKEVEKSTLAVRDRSNQTKFDVEVDGFISELVQKVKDKIIE